MRRIVALLLITALLFPLLGGCQSAKSGSDACRSFLNHLQNGEYGEAYAMLSASSRNDGEKARSARVTEQEFTDKYTNIFEALEVASVVYGAFSSVQEGAVLTAVSYKGVYRSVLAGDMENEFFMTAIREGGVWRIEWTPALIFPDMEWGDTVRLAPIVARRGEILADGAALAATVGAVSVYAAPSLIENTALFASQVSSLLGMTVAEVQAKLEKAFDDVAVLKQYYSNELLPSVREQLLTVKGVGIDDGNFKLQREYPYGSMLAHMLGYVGPISGSEAELKDIIADLNEKVGGENTYNADSIVGRSGLEKEFEAELHGRNGTEVFIRSASGEKKRTLYKKEARHGYDMELTVNFDLQARVEEVLSLVLYGQSTSGAVVVMNPITGEIQAAASYPAFDLNLFTRGISQRDYAALENNPAKPFINRITQGRYPPGSVLKAFTAAAALDADVLKKDDVFKGVIEEDYWQPTEYGVWIWPRIKRAAMKNRPGPLDLHNAVISSDNIYFANAALLMGEDVFFSYLKKLGMEEGIPFDINVAKAQLVNENTELTPKLLADTGYGQGEVLVTPLQLASMFSLFANGGRIVEPHIVKAYYEEESVRLSPIMETHTLVWKDGIFSSEAIAELIPMLEHVVSRNYNGTGHQLKVTSCTVAAKTGTAEIGSDKSREISWFAGFRTGVEPENARLVLVMLEVPALAEYSTLKYDIAREILKMSSPGTVQSED